MFVGIAGGYTMLLSLTLILFGWRPALLAAFLVVLNQFFRHIANDIDRIGWTMSNQADASAQPEVDVESSTRRYQTPMLWLVFALAQLANVALVGQAYVLADGVWAVATAGALLVIESFYALIRHVNRKTAFEQASYGFRDKGVFSGGPGTDRRGANDQSGEGRTQTRSAPRTPNGRADLSSAPTTRLATNIVFASSWRKKHPEPLKTAGRRTQGGYG